MEEFTIIQFSTKRAQRIPKRTARIHNKKGNRLIAFSVDISEDIREFGATHLNIIRSNITGEYYLQFSMDGQVKVRQNTKEHEGLVAQSCGAVQTLLELLDESETTERLDIKLEKVKSSIPGSIFFTFSK